jgi:hypothetical protein
MPREVALVGALFAAAAAAIAVTYSRLAPEELYHVSGSGAGAGLGRALVYLNFPTALAAVAVLAFAVDRLRESSRSGWVTALGLLALLLCLAVAWPGVVDQGDLDARPVNALAASGVLLTVALTAAAIATGGLGSLRPRRPGDVARVTAGAVLVALAVPWLLAELGFYAGHVPVLDSIFLSDELYADPDGNVGPAVHLGDHHGLDGVLLALTALALARAAPSVRSLTLGLWLRCYLALMLAYGLANAAQDAWLEQVVKRGWVDWRIPSVLVPAATWAWAVVLLAAVPAYVLLFGSGGRTLRSATLNGTEKRQEALR